MKTTSKEKTALWPGLCKITGPVGQRLLLHIHVHIQCLTQQESPANTVIDMKNEDVKILFIKLILIKIEYANAPVMLMFKDVDAPSCKAVEPSTHVLPDTLVYFELGQEMAVRLCKEGGQAPDTCTPTNTRENQTSH